jgi:phage/plasmid-associated DNA primase
LARGGLALDRGLLQNCFKEDFKCEVMLSMKNLIDTKPLVDSNKNAIAVTGSLVSNVVDAIHAQIHVKEMVEQPARLVPGIESKEYLAITNGLLDMTANPHEGNALKPHSPEWFSPVCLPYDYDQQARCPGWLEFLKRVMEGDQQRIDMLQEWMG